MIPNTTALKPSAAFSNHASADTPNEGHSLGQSMRNLLQIKELFPRAAILVTGGCALILNGIAVPIVEELYFRGHLLPRLSRFAYWAPLLNVALFSLYHLWTPWMFLSRIVLLIPMVYLVWWRRNIFIGILAHCLLNLIGTIVLFAQLLG